MSIDLGHGSPICPPCRRRGALAPSPALASSSVPDRNPLRVASPQMDAPPPVNGSSPSVEARNPQGALSLPLISLRGESSSSTPFWGSGLERERGSCLVYWSRRLERGKQRRWRMGRQRSRTLIWKKTWRNKETYRPLLRVQKDGQKRSFPNFSTLVKSWECLLKGMKLKSWPCSRNWSWELEVAPLGREGKRKNLVSSASKES